MIPYFEKKRFPPAVFFALFLFTLICSAAWVGDDAFITLHSVKNFLNGYGWRYNISERVQTFTNPLLLICMTVASFFTKEYYFTLLFLNLSATAAALFLFYFKQEKSAGNMIFCSVLLILSAAFKDYATSGLENSFGYLLSALFFLKFFSKTEFDGKDVFFLSLMTGLTLLNRMDTVLIVFPALAYACLSGFAGNKKRVLYLVPAGLSPFILWELFCIVYYGFPFPNTYYAKMQAGFPLNEYLIRGVWYYEYSFLYDTVTLSGIVAGLFAMFYKPADGRFISAGTGIILYLLYILYIGGDFMAGRFFALPFFVSVFVFPYGKIRSGMKTTVLLSAICLTIPVYSVYKRNIEMPYAYTPLRCFYPWIEEELCFLPRKGISNEKIFWKGKIKSALKKDFKKLERLAMDLSDHPFNTTAGIIPFSKGERHVSDLFGLTDPLISRMPPLHYREWEVGHIIRLLPKGYKETLLSGKNMIEDKETALYYDKLKQVVSGSLFSTERFNIIRELNTRKAAPSSVSERADLLPKLTTQQMYMYQTYVQHSYRSAYDFQSLSFSLDGTSLPYLQKHLKKYDLLVPFIAPILIDVGRNSKASALLIETDTWADFPCERISFVFLNTRKNLISGLTVPYLSTMRVSVPEEIKNSGFDKIIMAKPLCRIEHLDFFTEAFLFKKIRLED